MTEPTQEEAEEALRILSGQCGPAKIRKENKAIIKKRLKSIVPDETYEALNMGPPIKRLGPEPSSLHLDNPNPGKRDILLLQARLQTYEAHGQDALSPQEVREGFSSDHVIYRLTEKIQQLEEMNKPSTHSSTAMPPDDRGGVGETLELLLEIRQARALLHSQITEQKKRTKVKIQKLNLAEVTILDAYEDHDKQLYLFDLPPVPDDVRAILDDPQI